MMGWLSIFLPVSTIAAAASAIFAARSAFYTRKSVQYIYSLTNQSDNDINENNYEDVSEDATNITLSNNTKEIITEIQSYINNTQNSAIMLTGNWGVGKTYFVNNVLAKRLKSATCSFKKIKLVRFSCFGVTSADDFYKKLLEAVFRFANNHPEDNKDIYNAISQIVNQITKILI